jgi:ABC-type glutathione transport system ATPase component
MALLEVENLVKEFTRKRGLFAPGSAVRAVDGVTFSVSEGETFGLVGESGSGKTTTGRCILRLIEPTSGAVRFRGEDVLAFSSARMRQARRDMQIVFQDPYSSLNPRMRVGAIVEEPLIIHNVGTKPQRRARVAELFELVGLDPSQLARYPHQFSGGQRQRVAIARALVNNPSILLADEPTGNLDSKTGTEIMGVFARLHESGNTIILVTHEPDIAAYAHRVISIRDGQVEKDAKRAA